MVIKKSQITSKSSAKTVKSSAKKDITNNKTIIVKKPETKKTVKAIKAPGTKLSRAKTAPKPAVTKSASEIKKIIKTTKVKKTKKISIAAKKSDKTSIATAKGKKALPIESLKTISVSKSETPGKEPLKKSTVKIVTAKTKITQKKTIKSVSTKKPSVRKVSKVVARKTEGKTAKEIKAPPKTLGAAKKEKNSTVKIVKTAKSIVTPNKTIESVSTKKPSVRKVSKVVARKTDGETAKEIKAPTKALGAEKKEKKSTVKTVKTGIQKKSVISNTIPQIKETVTQKTVLKPKEKTEAPPSTIRNTVKKKGASSLITTEPLPALSKKTTATYITPPQAEAIPKKTAKLKVFLPEEELPPEEAPQAPFPQLPEEYGENELLLMEVDPSIVFVSWEIKPDDISGEAGKLSLRVYDVTGIDFDGTNANRFFDILLRNRADSKFFDIKMQGRDIIMEIGLLHPEGAFKAIKQSNRVSMPALQTFDELDITGSLSDSETLIGY